MRDNCDGCGLEICADDLHITHWDGTSYKLLCDACFAMWHAAQEDQGLAEYEPPLIDFARDGNT